MPVRCLTDAKHPPWAYEASHGIARSRRYGLSLTSVLMQKAGTIPNPLILNAQRYRVRMVGIR
jgi:hypothetical protein